MVWHLLNTYMHTLYINITWSFSIRFQSWIRRDLRFNVNLWREMYGMKSTCNSPFCRNVRELGRVSSIDWIENLSNSTEMLLNEKLPSQVQDDFSGKLSKWQPCKVAKFHTNPFNLKAPQPNPYRLSILGNRSFCHFPPLSTYFYSR